MTTRRFSTTSKQITGNRALLNIASEHATNTVKQCSVSILLSRGPFDEDAELPFAQGESDMGRCHMPVQSSDAQHSYS